MEQQVRGAPKAMGGKNSGPDDKVRRALGALNEVRTNLARKLVDYVVGHEHQLKGETAGEDSYGFTLHQMDELFLVKLNIVERAMAELARFDVHETTTTYECLEVAAKRDDLPQRVADALAERNESELLSIAVLNASPEQADLLLVLAREEKERAERRRE